MKKILIFALSAIAIQSYAAVQWNCTSPDIKQSYLPMGCTGVSGNSSASNATSSPPSAGTTTPPSAENVIDMSSCISSDYSVAIRCADSMATSFATNGRAILEKYALFNSNSNEYRAEILLKNSDGTYDYILPRDGDTSLEAYSNYSEVPQNAAICNNINQSSKTLSTSMSNCPSGTYAKTLNANGDPDKLVLVP